MLIIRLVIKISYSNHRKQDEYVFKLTYLSQYLHSGTRMLETINLHFAISFCY